MIVAGRSRGAGVRGYLPAVRKPYLLLFSFALGCSARGGSGVTNNIVDGGASDIGSTPTDQPPGFDGGAPDTGTPGKDSGPVETDVPAVEDIVQPPVDVHVCEPGEVMGCGSPTALRVCDESGAGYVDRACPARAHATVSCNDGVCGDFVCDPGFGDCNRNADDGCESALDTNDNCGACRNFCVGEQTCRGGMCLLPGVDAGPPLDVGVRDTGVVTDTGPRDTGVVPDVGPLPDGGIAGTTLISGLGGPSGYGLAENCFSNSDDGSWATADAGTTGSAIALPVAVRLNGSLYSSVFLNTNGNVSFGASLGSYSPTPFPSMSGRPLIAPWFADVDTRGGGSPARNAVCWASDTNRFVATWFNVGYYASHIDKLNSFQLVLSSVAGGNPGDVDVEFRYARCAWTTGDASGGAGGFGGTPARAGIDGGDGVNGVTLPGSGTMAVLDLCRTSNVATPGVWRYRLRGGVVSSF